MARGLCYNHRVLTDCLTAGTEAIMLKQSGRTAALYYRVASAQTDNLYLDNQMQTLLCYANKQGIDSFTLYADVGVSGITLDRPAFNALKADIEAGRIGKLIIRDFSRIARDFILADNFIEWAQVRGVEIISVTEGELNTPPCANIAALCRSLLKGGGRV